MIDLKIRNHQITPCNHPEDSGQRISYAVRC